jgi:hypothetical protein
MLGLVQLQAQVQPGLVSVQAQAGPCLFAIRDLALLGLIES